MSMGAYDEDEHERRAEKTGQVDAEFDDDRSQFRGTLSYESGDSTEALLDQFKQLQGE
ncbi:DUF5786 family protein [Haloplanus aerogenes]|uniref:DUF5786 domain-containing protein n=1 Tax=Haloplanus aerogenes TaxID=660522 RepID=A0A3M0D1G0_9EURY|nr:DUF5786 family protein [Haloplanus aerogenes]RMB13316.1 hypothetical protein ATH50_2649 [Haloplanus aerogenes]